MISIVQIVYGNCYSVTLGRSPGRTDNTSRKYLRRSRRVHLDTFTIQIKAFHSVNCTQLLKGTTPARIAEYKIGLLLYKIFNLLILENEWQQLNWNQAYTMRQNTFHLPGENHPRVKN
jgi:hypothetical protein